MLVRRHRALLGLSIWMGVALVMAGFLTQPSELSSLFLGLMLFPYAVGAHTEGRRAYFGLGLAVITIVVVALDSDAFVWGDIFFPGAFATMLWLAGRAVRSRSRLTAELHEAARAPARAARGGGRTPPSPRSAAGSRARCTTSSPTASRRWSSRPAARAASSGATRPARSRRPR